MSPSSPPSRRSSKIGLALVSALIAATACSDPVSVPEAQNPLVQAPSYALIGGSAWSASGPGIVRLINDGYTGAPGMNYLLPAALAPTPHEWTFSATADQGGLVTVDYDYSGGHAGCTAGMVLSAFVTHDGVTTSQQLLEHFGDCESQGFNETGSHTFSVQAGDEFGFTFGGYDTALTAPYMVGTLFLAEGTPPTGDETGPVITPNFTGTMGDDGWYTTDVGLTWTVNDPESAVTDMTGCDPAGVNTDTSGDSFTCSATSAGGTTSVTVTVKRDATPPTLAFLGNAGTYTVDQQVAITCSATDDMSGIAQDCTSAGVSGDAYTFGVGTHTLTATATDHAGNTGTASTELTVLVTPESLCSLTERWVSKKGVAHSMCQQLSNGAYRAYANHVRAQSGKSVTPPHAAILVALADEL